MSQPPLDTRIATDMEPDAPSPPEAEIVVDRCPSLPWWAMLLLPVATVIATVIFLPAGIFGVPAAACFQLTSKRPYMAGQILVVGSVALFAVAGYVNYDAGDLMLGPMMMFYLEAPGMVYSIAAAVILVNVARKNRSRRVSSSLAACIAILVPVLWYTTVMPLTSELRTERVSHPISPDDFPSQLNTLLEIAEQEGIKVEPFRVFCVSRSWYEEYYWQTGASPELLAWSTEQFRLLPLEKESEKLRHFWERMPREWRVSQATEAEFFISTDWCYTEYGTILMHDKANGRFYFWYMNDF